MDKLFSVDEAGMRRKGNWLWWWWIFFFREPRGHPKQLMVLWSTKNEARIHCNDLEIKLREDFVRRQGDSFNLDGAVAAWLYDGKKMRENYLLEQTPVIVSEKGVQTRSPDSRFTHSGKGFRVSLKDFDFRIGAPPEKGFYAPAYHESRFPLGFSYDILKFNRVPFSSNQGNGSAYFQRVRVNAPAPPWFWGLYHFDFGACLHYYEPHVGVTALTDRVEDAWLAPVKREFEFYDGRKLHRNKNVTVKPFDGGFLVESDGPAGKARVEIECYSHAAWRFRKSAFNRLTYNEYPSRVREFSFRNSAGEWTLDDLGEGVGNAEHATGLLW